MRKSILLGKIFLLFSLFIFLAGCSTEEKASPVIKSDSALEISTPIDHISAVFNTQGLAYHDGYFIIGIDLGKGLGKLLKIDMDGNVVENWGNEAIPIGHAAGLSYDDKDNIIFVANGGGKNPMMVYEVDASNGRTIKKTTDLSSYGHSGLVAYDEYRDVILIHTSANDHGEIYFRILDRDYHEMSDFHIPNKGTPQGLAMYNDYVYYYTSNKISVFDFNGTYKFAIDFNMTTESEGAAVMIECGCYGLALGSKEYIGIMKTCL